MEDTAGDPTGTWGQRERGRPWLSFDDARCTGSDGCNKMAGPWRQSCGGRIEVGPMMVTRMFCEGVDTWLSNVEAVAIDGDRMLVFGTDGKRLGSLRRTAGIPGGGG